MIGASFHPDNRVVRAGHAHIGDEGGAARQNALIGGGHVRVRADDGRDASVEIPAHGLLLAGGLGVNIHDDHFDVPAEAWPVPDRRCERDRRWGP